MGLEPANWETDGLTVKQRKFVIAIIMGKSREEAARFAGYSGTTNTLRAMASQNMRKPAIRDAIKNAKLDLTQMTDIAVQQFKEAALAETPDSWTKALKMRGAENLAKMASGGFGGDSVTVNIQNNTIDIKNMSETDLLKEIEALQAKALTHSSDDDEDDEGFEDTSESTHESTSGDTPGDTSPVASHVLDAEVVDD